MVGRFKTKPAWVPSTDSASQHVVTDVLYDPGRPDGVVLDLEAITTAGPYIEPRF